MYYALYDKVLGTILGISSDEDRNADLSEYTRITDEVFDFLKINNGNYCIDDSKVNDIITLDCLKPIVDHYDIEGVINNMIRKNTYYCNMYIENGVTININNDIKKHTYTQIDQLNIEQAFNLVNQNILNDNTGVFVKFTDEETYTKLTVEQFKELYFKLLKNKYYQLFYLQSYNNYLNSLKNSNVDKQILANKLHRMSYETGLPNEHRKEVQEQINNIFN